MAKVHEKAKLKFAGFQVIENLSAMLVSELSDSLQFDDYFFVADKIGKIFLRQDSTSILEGQSRLRDYWNTAMLEFNAETFLIRRLVKAQPLSL
jgi:hypothetical protein